MLFAYEFWKPPNVYDAAGVAGLVIGIVSIWLSWWLARRDSASTRRRIAPPVLPATKCAALPTRSFRPGYET